MKNVVFSGLFAVSIPWIFSAVARAEFDCHGRVAYSVESVATTRLETAPKNLGEVKESSTPLPVPTPVISIVFIAQVEAKGDDEAKAKTALQKVGARLVEKARATCRENHENVGGCISAKFEASATALRSLDFSARKALEESLRSDCEVQRGRCLGAELKDVVCAEIIVAAPATESPVAEPGKEDKKKAKK